MEIHGVSNSYSQKEPAVGVAEAAEAAAAESEPNADDSAAPGAVEPAAADEAAADDPAMPVAVEPAVVADDAAALEPPEELALGPEPVTTL